MAAKKECPRCGQAFPLTPKHWYLYAGRTPIHKPCEVARSSASKKSSREAKRGEAK